ncbi:hypothetical protein EG329_008589 [Mollisiaceae sp. DMI_Dod_QoI]|nr:hypothetical protein EG329_008589 [Helotiales sp. DMI_Dod_QoI]
MDSITEIKTPQGSEKAVSRVQDTFIFESQGDRYPTRNTNGWRRGLQYNSVVFTSMPSIAYLYAIVDEDFLDTAKPINLSPNDLEFPDVAVMYESLRQQATNGTMKRYEAVDCMTAFATTFVNRYSEVLLVTNSTDTDSDVHDQVWIDTSQIPYAWICGDSYSSQPYLDKSAICTLATAIANVSRWELTGRPINYCMVNEVSLECKLNFSLPSMMVVIIANIFKISIMSIIAFTHRTNPLATIGDALSSFLQEPDPATRNMCLVTNSSFKSKDWTSQHPGLWQPKRRRWFEAASIGRWCICNVLCLATIGVGLFLLVQGMAGSGMSHLSDLARIGFGVTNPGAFVDVAMSSVTAGVLLANLPQLIFTFLYVIYNGLFTCMLEAKEWSRFAKARLPLRVSHPEGEQRSTGYLQLPYTFSMSFLMSQSQPLLVFAALMHYLISESLFLVYVPILLAGPEPPDPLNPMETIIQVGYSCIAIFVSIIVGFTALVILNLNAIFRHYDPGVPLVGSCSAAISAACHPPAADCNTAWKCVQWGVF